MDSNKILVGGLIGGVTAFILGFIIYGNLMTGFFAENAGSATGVNREQADFVWWAMIVAHLAWGYLFAIIYGRWASISTFATGAKAGAVIGLLIALFWDLILYGTTNMSTLTGALVDVVLSAVISAIVGGVVGWWLGRK